MPRLPFEETIISETLVGWAFSTIPFYLGRENRALPVSAGYKTAGKYVVGKQETTYSSC